MIKNCDCRKPFLFLLVMLTALNINASLSNEPCDFLCRAGIDNSPKSEDVKSQINSRINKPQSSNTSLGNINNETIRGFLDTLAWSIEEELGANHVTEKLLIQYESFYERANEISINGINLVIKDDDETFMVMSIEQIRFTKEFLIGTRAYADKNLQLLYENYPKIAEKASLYPYIQSSLDFYRNQRGGYKGFLDVKGISLSNVFVEEVDFPAELLMLGWNKNINFEISLEERNGVIESIMRFDINSDLKVEGTVGLNGFSSLEFVESFSKIIDLVFASDGNGFSAKSYYGCATDFQCLAARNLGSRNDMPIDDLFELFFTNSVDDPYRAYSLFIEPLNLHKIGLTEVSFKVNWSKDLYNFASAMSGGAIDGALFAAKGFGRNQMSRYDMMALLQNLDFPNDTLRIISNPIYDFYLNSMKEINKFTSDPRGIEVGIKVADGISVNSLGGWPALVQGNLSEAGLLAILLNRSEIIFRANPN